MDVIGKAFGRKPAKVTQRAFEIVDNVSALPLKPMDVIPKVAIPAGQKTLDKISSDEDQQVKERLLEEEKKPEKQ